MEDTVVVVVLLVVLPLPVDDDTTGVAGISTGIACPFGNLQWEQYM